MINICFTCDGNYLRPLEVAILSILETTKSASEIRFHIVKNSDFDVDYIVSICSEYGAGVTFYDYSSSFAAPDRFTSAIYSRLSLDELLDEKVDKILYLDCDLVVVGDINDIYSVDISSSYLAAVRDLGDDYVNEFSERHGLTRYFNSGVLLLNMSRIRADSVFETARDFYSSELKYADQDMLNAAVRGDWLEIDRRYNYMSSQVSESSVVIHYAHCKPWEYFCFNKNSGRYWSVENRIKSKSPKMKRPNSAKRIARNIFYKISGGI